MPAVAGRFYPADAKDLKTMLSEMVVKSAPKRRVLGALMPHAGYVFSGPTAGKVAGAIEVPERVILLNPSHQYDYPPVALWPGGAWWTPLGEAAVDEELTEAIGKFPGVTRDEKAHLGEHSGEVIVPFLQCVQPNLKLAVLCVTSGAQYGTLRQLGQRLAKLIQDTATPVLLVASSDMSHESGPRALQVVRDHDLIAIERMKELDAEGLLRECLRIPITMCGVRPATVLIEAVKSLGAVQGEVLMQATSADSPYGRGNYVVGYAGMVFV